MLGLLGIMTPRFRFACRARTSTGLRDALAWTELAQKAEDLGYDLLVVADHIRTGQAPLPTLAYVAGKTTSLRLAVEVLNNDFRHPAIVAKEIATVDSLSEGRLEVGLGCGYRQQDYDTTGLILEPLSTRVARLAESIVVLKALLGQSDPVDFDGDHYQLNSLVGVPNSAQTPHPPLLIGGRSKPVLELAAREANTYSVTPGEDPDGWSIERLTRIAERARLIAATAGNNFLELHMLPKGCYVGDAAESFLLDYAARKRIPPSKLRSSAHALVGSRSLVADHLCMLYERSNVSYVTVPSDRMLEFAPVIDMVNSRLSLTGR
jgi:probable F420-dependent oxidoreductase